MNIINNVYDNLVFFKAECVETYYIYLYWFLYTTINDDKNLMKIVKEYVHEGTSVRGIGNSW